jgi:hypothetical protein
VRMRVCVGWGGGNHRHNQGTLNLANAHPNALPTLKAVGGKPDPVTGTIKVVPHTTVPCTPQQCWLAAVRYAVVDVPQCALYNAAELPAGQFDFPVPWAHN